MINTAAAVSSQLLSIPKTFIEFIIFLLIILHDRCNGVNTVLMNAQYKERDFREYPLVVGTRGSPLAIAQAEETCQKLMKFHAMPKQCFDIRVIKTTGDLVQNRPLSEIGGKGLFTKEIEEQLLGGHIDIAVHSMKDMPTVLPSDLSISTVLAREDVRDSFVSVKYNSIDDLPIGATVGTSSLRRKAQLLAQRDDLNVIEFRGNVQTRLKKLELGVADATFLACAGLSRLGMKELINPIPIESMLPAVAQGAIGIEQRTDNELISDLLKPINDQNTETQLTAERSFLKVLDGSCRTPIGGYAEIIGSKMKFFGEILKPDGSQIHKDIWHGEMSDAEQIGRDAGIILKEKGGDKFFK